RRHTRFSRDWSSDVCSSDLLVATNANACIDLFADVRSTSRALPDRGRSGLRVPHCKARATSTRRIRMHTAHRRRGLTAVALAGAAGLVLAGCTGGGGGGGGGDADCSDYEQYGTFDNASVEVYATIIDVEADQLVESWADFEECTGITIDYVGTQEAETQINVRVAAGDAPDIMIV